MKQVQTILAEEEVKELKKKSGTDTVKDALSKKAINHYLTCHHTEDSLKKRLEDTMKRKKDKLTTRL